MIEGEDPRYELRGKLGEGGMAEVFRAKDHLIGEIVAIKIPKGELYDNAEAAPRFRREAYVLSQLQHPNIVRFLDWGFARGRGRAESAVTSSMSWSSSTEAICLT